MQEEILINGVGGVAGEHSENKSREHTEIKTVKDIKFCTNFYNKGDKISQPPSSKQIEQKNRETKENYYKTNSGGQTAKRWEIQN